MSSVALPFALAAPPVFTRDGQRLLLVSEKGEIWSLRLAGDGGDSGRIEKAGAAEKGTLVALGWMDDALATTVFRDGRLIFRFGDTVDTVAPAGYEPAPLRSFHVWPGETDPIDQSPVVLPLVLSRDGTLYFLSPLEDTHPRLRALAEGVTLVADRPADTIFLGRPEGGAPAGASSLGVYRLGRRYGWRAAQEVLVEDSIAAVGSFVGGTFVLANQSRRGIWSTPTLPSSSPFSVPTDWTFVGLADDDVATPLVMSPEHDRICRLGDVSGESSVLRASRPIAGTLLSASRPLLVAFSRDILDFVRTDQL
jgi:hypothetical protein